MSAPIWFALPPEVHSALLSSGPGPGPLLAAAAAWSSLGAEYAAAADELGGLLAAVQAGLWDGPTAAQYAAAHGPYLSWLLESVAKSTAAATVHQTAAGAYTAALATMPTLAELAANHAIHAALVATNFFGINTIPIALNEADYVRMWIQAAETMSTYQAVTASALATVPVTLPAPQTVAPSTAQAAAASPTWQEQLTAMLRAYTQNWAWPVSKDLNPAGWPFPPSPFVKSISAAVTPIPGMTPALATAIGWAVFHTLMIFWPLGQQAIQLATSLIVPALAAVTAASAAGVAAGAAGAVGVAVPLSVTLPIATAAAPPVGAVPAPAAPASGFPTSAGTAPIPASTAAPSPATTIGVGPTGGGPGVGFGPTATNPLGAAAGMADTLYAVGLSGLTSRSSASRRAARKAAEPSPDDVEAPTAAAASARDRARSRRRRVMGAKDRGHRYEFMDLGADPDVEESDRGAGPLGFAGAAAKAGVTPAAGLLTLDGDDLGGGGPTRPILPSSWSPDSPNAGC